MNILFLNHNVIWRSTFFRCYHFGRQLVKRGHQVTIYTIHPSRRCGLEEQTLSGVRVVLFPDLLWGIGRSGWDPWDTWLRLRRLQRETYDLVHAFDCRPVVIHPALALQRRGVPLVIDWADWWGRGGVIAERKNPLLRYGFAPIETWYEEHFRTRADGTTVISEALRARAAGLGVPDERILKLHSGADVEDLKPIDKVQARKTLGLDPKLKILGFMGFVHYDIELAVRTFARLYREHPETRLLLAGKPSPLVKRLARAQGLEPGILDYGIIPYADLPRVLSAADVFLLPFADKPANVGRWPNKVGDYLALGRPVLTSPVGEMRELFTTHEAGALAPADPAAMAQAAWELLAAPSRCERLGRAARQVAESHLSWERRAVELERFYARVLERKHADPKP